MPCFFFFNSGSHVLEALLDAGASPYCTEPQTGDSLMHKVCFLFSQQIYGDKSLVLKVIVG